MEGTLLGAVRDQLMILTNEQKEQLILALQNSMSFPIRSDGKIIKELRKKEFSDGYLPLLRSIGGFVSGSIKNGRDILV